jgi:hypothetical protein
LALLLGFVDRVVSAIVSEGDGHLIGHGITPLQSSGMASYWNRHSRARENLSPYGAWR